MKEKQNTIIICIPFILCYPLPQMSATTNSICIIWKMEQFVKFILTKFKNWQRKQHFWKVARKGRFSNVNYLESSVFREVIKKKLHIWKKRAKLEVLLCSRWQRWRSTEIRSISLHRHHLFSLCIWIYWLTERVRVLMSSELNVILYYFFTSYHWIVLCYPHNQEEESYQQSVDLKWTQFPCQ